MNWIGLLCQDKGIEQSVFLANLSLSLLANFSSKEGFDKYMTAFIFDYYKSVIRLVDKAMRKIDNSVRGTIANEILIHLHHCVNESKRFHGRENELFKARKTKTYVFVLL